MKGRGSGGILTADVHAFHDTIGHVFAISGAIIFSGCVGTRVALCDISGQDLVVVTPVSSQIPTSFSHRSLIEDRSIEEASSHYPVYEL